jgi:hypothetical protein
MTNTLAYLPRFNEKGDIKFHFGANPLKHICKLGHFIILHNFPLYSKMVKLTKRVNKVTPKSPYRIISSSGQFVVFVPK